MTRQRAGLVALGVIVVIGAAAIGFLLGSGGPDATGSPTPSPAASEGVSCEVSASPTTIVVNPDTGQAAETTLLLVGTDFPPDSGVTLVLPGAALDFVTDSSGSFSFTFAPVAGETYPAPPDLEPGPLTWTVIGWDAASAPGDFGSVPPRICEVRVEVTIELTHTPSPTPPTDLSAGGYAEIVADGVRVRVEPSLDATVVGALFTGDVVRILAPAQVVDGIPWYQVETVIIQSGDPLRGFVAAGADGQVFLRPTVAPPPPTPSPSPSPSPG